MNPINDLLIKMYPIEDTSDANAKMAAALEGLPLDVLETMTKNALEKESGVLSKKEAAEGPFYPQKNETSNRGGNVGAYLKASEMPPLFGKRETKKEGSAEMETAYRTTAAIIKQAIDAAENLSPDVAESVLKTAASRLYDLGLTKEGLSPISTARRIGSYARSQAAKKLTVPFHLIKATTPEALAAQKSVAKFTKAGQVERVAELMRLMAE